MLIMITKGNQSDAHTNKNKQGTTESSYNVSRHVEHKTQRKGVTVAAQNSKPTPYRSCPCLQANLGERKEQL